MVTRYERTTPDYPTYGPPETGESWAEYFRRIRAESQPGPEDTDDDSDDAQREQLGRGSGLPPHESPAPTALARYAKLFTAKGFDTALGWSEYIVKGGIYGPTAAKAGQKKPDQHVILAWIAAYKRGYGLCKLLYKSVNGKSYMCDWRQLNKQYVPVSDTELKEWINGAEG